MAADSEALKKRIALLEETVETLRKDLIHDKLTGLKTRAFFEEEARFYFGVAVGEPRGPRRKQWFGFKNLSFIFFDIDDFKKVNDTLGHLAGDEVLRSVAETVMTSTRDGDTAARWGGEEIIISLVGATEADALYKAEDIRRRVAETRFGNYPDLKITVSAGVVSSVAGASFEETVERADRALYEAKRLGKDRVVAYSSIHKG